MPLCLDTGWTELVPTIVDLFPDHVPSLGSQALKVLALGANLLPEALHEVTQNIAASSTTLVDSSPQFADFRSVEFADLRLDLSDVHIGKADPPNGSNEFSPDVA